MSFGKDIKYRELGISRTLSDNDVVLDIGSGPGVMVRTALEMGFNLGDVALLDVLPEMLVDARRRLVSDKINTVTALFEYNPFRDNTFNVALAGFAFRDALNLHQALEETARVLRDNSGKLLIIDLGKPDNLIFRYIIGLYWRFWIPFIGFIILGRKGLMYSKLYETYKRLPTNREFRKFLEKHFEHISFTTKLAGGVVIIIAERKWKCARQFEKL